MQAPNQRSGGTIEQVPKMQAQGARQPGLKVFSPKYMPGKNIGHRFQNYVESLFTPQVSNIATLDNYHPQYAP